MEENSFESKLQALVQQADQNLRTGDGARERVWQKVKRKNYPSKWSWIASAAAVLIGIMWIFYQPEQALNSTSTKKSKPQQPNTQIEKATQPMNAKTRVRQVKRFSGQIKATKTTSTVADTQTTILTLTETQSIKPVEPPVATLRPATEKEALQPVNQQTEPSFTVQFKRGKPQVKEDESSFSTALKTFKLKRDTSYFANAEEKQPSIIKLSFKKEN